MKLLLIEDDITLANHLKKDFTRTGYAVDLAHDGIDGEFIGREYSYDVIVLDLGLPNRSGLEVLRNWRATGMQSPVIILTARDAWHERVDGLKAGADDYLGKPFHIEELLARIDTLVRRKHGQVGQALNTNGIQLNEEHQTITLGDGKHFTLTATEYRLLKYMMLNTGKVLSKSQLTEHIYDNDSDRDSNVIEVYIRRLRSYLGEDLIKTRRGQGYIFGEPNK